MPSLKQAAYVPCILIVRMLQSKPKSLPSSRAVHVQSNRLLDTREPSQAASLIVPDKCKSITTEENSFDMLNLHLRLRLALSLRLLLLDTLLPTRTGACTARGERTFKLSLIPFFILGPGAILACHRRII
jgi:hypothetical protein